MLSGTVEAEVVNDRRHVRELAGGVGPNIRTVGFLRTRREHLHRCFIGMDDLLPEHHITTVIKNCLPKS